MDEWWYNPSFHTSLNMTPLQALDDYPQPLIVELNLPLALNLSLQTHHNREKLMQILSRTTLSRTKPE
jgi:hypothetical protein